MRNCTNIHPVTKVVWNYFPETKPTKTGWYLTAIECTDGSLQVLSNRWEDYGWCELGNHVYAWSFDPDAPPMQNEMEVEKSQVVWYKYPDKKPQKTDHYLIHCPMLNKRHFDFWHNDIQKWDRHDEYVIHWAYLPEAPKEATDETKNM